jgi:hypothetical protein
MEEIGMDNRCNNNECNFIDKETHACELKRDYDIDMEAEEFVDDDVCGRMHEEYTGDK